MSLPSSCESRSMKVPRQQRNVFPALAQRRNADFNHVQAVKQIVAELAFGYGNLQIDVGGRDHAHVHAHLFGPADAVEAALLEHAQQIHLQLGGDIADFVEEDGSAVGHFELAALALRGAGERAFLMAEQLGFEERLGQRGAGDRYERLLMRDRPEL
jgi:hypothetical protein